MRICVAAGSTRWLAGFIFGAPLTEAALHHLNRTTPINRNRFSKVLSLSKRSPGTKTVRRCRYIRMEAQGKSKNKWRASAIAGDKVEVQFGTSPVHFLACLSKQRLHVPAVQLAYCISICTPTSIQDIAASFAPTFLIPTSRVKTA
jgi:hypothetical protein